MWPLVLQKIARLKSYDTRFIVLGAATHRYEFRAPASAEAVRLAEKRLGVSLPEELKFIYLELGNGGVGPDDGFYPVEKIKGFNPGHRWPGIEVYLDAKNPLSEAEMRGIVAFADGYYSGVRCVIRTGKDAGSVILYSAEDYVCGEGNSIADMYDRWLDQELANFERVRQMIFAGADIQTMMAAFDGHPRGGLSLVASLLGLRFFRGASWFWVAIDRRGLNENDTKLPAWRFRLRWPARMYFNWHIRKYRRAFQP